MTRPILDVSQIHPAVRDRVGGGHGDTVAEVRSAVAANRVVVVGMRGNPCCRKARRALDGAGIAHRYIGYGGYFSQWRRRNALKMWTGWPTMPIVFVDGHLVGGADDLRRLIDRGDLK